MESVTIKHQRPKLSIFSHTMDDTYIPSGRKKVTSGFFRNKQIFRMKLTSFFLLSNFY